MADPSPEPESPPVDPAVALVIVTLETVADLFASIAMQINQHAGVLEAFSNDLPSLIGACGPMTLDGVRAARDDYAANPLTPDELAEFRDQQAEREAAEIERRLAEDDRTEVIRVGPTGAAMRFPRP